MQQKNSKRELIERWGICCFSFSSISRCTKNCLRRKASGKKRQSWEILKGKSGEKNDWENFPTKHNFSSQLAKLITPLELHTTFPVHERWDLCFATLDRITPSLDEWDCKINAITGFRNLFCWMFINYIQDESIRFEERLCSLSENWFECSIESFSSELNFRVMRARNYKR